MQRLLAILVVTCVCSAGFAAEIMVSSYVCERDNVNTTASVLKNYGQKSNGRFAKSDGDGTMYCDWSVNQLEALWAEMQGVPPAPNTDWEVRFAVTGTTWDADHDDPTDFGAFFSENDWTGPEDCSNAGPSNDVGACDSFADSVPVPETPWLNAGVPVSFWGLAENTNSTPFPNFRGSAGPAVPYLMRAPVDMAVLQDLIFDTNCRGLRCHSDVGGHNNQVYLRGQWGCPGPAAAQLVLTLGGGPVLPYPGDATDDSKVDGADYTVWADNYGRTDAPLWSAGGWTVGNFTEDTNVDGADYTVWADEYGYGTGGAAVPEPVTLGLLAIGAVAVFRRRK